MPVHEFVFSTCVRDLDSAKSRNEREREISGKIPTRKNPGGKFRDPAPRLGFGFFKSFKIGLVIKPDT